MINSMTGYGKSQVKTSSCTIIVEIRSLNSKQMDLTLRLPNRYRSRELDIRSLLSERLERGKVDCVISETTPEGNGAGIYPAINQDAFTFYLRQLNLTAERNNLELPSDDKLMAIIMHLPEVTRPTDNAELSDSEWLQAKAAIEEAVEHFQSFRAQEGKALQDMFEEKLSGIEALLESVEPYEKGRIEGIRQRLLSSLSQLSKDTQNSVDRNRLEQEMIFYLEKLDVTEEKVRLSNHIRYFRETMQTTGAGVGKKLGFIAQEMGREINTLGSKSNQSEMQIIVVKMKDLLEQIKEQVLNVL